MTRPQSRDALPRRRSRCLTVVAIRRTPGQRDRARRLWCAENRRIDSIARALEAPPMSGGQWADIQAWARSSR